MVGDESLQVSWRLGRVDSGGLVGPVAAIVDLLVLGRWSASAVPPFDPLCGRQLGDGFARLEGGIRWKWSSA